MQVSKIPYAAAFSIDQRNTSLREFVSSWKPQPSSVAAALRLHREYLSQPPEYLFSDSSISAVNQERSIQQDMEFIVKAVLGGVQGIKVRYSNELHMSCESNIPGCGCATRRTPKGTWVVGLLNAAHKILTVRCSQCMHFLAM